MKSSTESKKDKLEKILNCYGITWGELSELTMPRLKPQKRIISTDTERTSL